MKTTHFQLTKYLLSFVFFVFLGCVNDDFDQPEIKKQSHSDLDAKVTTTLAAIKTLYTSTIYDFTTDDWVKAYVSSSDETGNIYKTIFVQDQAENPTQGLTIIVDAASTYLKYPQGSAVYIKLKGLSLNEYNGVLQLGVNKNGKLERIPENQLSDCILASDQIVNITPKVMTLESLGSSTKQYIGCLVQINDAQFGMENEFLCETYADENEGKDVALNDGATTSKNRLARNSNFSSFANHILPSGRGEFVAILSKYGGNHQFYINRTSDLNMKGARIDGSTPVCAPDNSVLVQKTIAEIKQLYSGSLYQIPNNYSIKGKVTANDETGNLYKCIYIEDETGGIRINIDKFNLFQDYRFRVGQELSISIKDLYIGSINEEIALGGLYQTTLGQVEPKDIYKHFFVNNTKITQLQATEKTINSLTNSDVGKLVKIKDLQFVISDLEKPYALNYPANRMLEDRNGDRLILRTNNKANFAGKDVDSGSGDVYGILSIYNGTYQLLARNLIDVSLKNARHDGYITYKPYFYDDFTGYLSDNWNVVSVIGTSVWRKDFYSGELLVRGGASSAPKETESWLVSKPIFLRAGAKYQFSFDSEKTDAGNDVECYISTHYTGNISTTIWTLLPALFDTNTTANTWYNSGKMNLTMYAGKNVYIAYKYTSTNTESSTWKVASVQIRTK